MISSVEEYVRLRFSDDLVEQARATHERANDKVWLGVIADYPDLRIWVARNKTISLDILRLLALDDDPRVRSEVAAKRMLDRALFEVLMTDPDERVRCVLLRNAKCPADISRVMNIDMKICGKSDDQITDVIDISEYRQDHA